MGINIQNSANLSKISSKSKNNTNKTLKMEIQYKNGNISMNYHRTYTDWQEKPSQLK